MSRSAPRVIRLYRFVTGEAAPRGAGEGAVTGEETSSRSDEVGEDAARDGIARPLSTQEEEGQTYAEFFTAS
jgi:hypothetical protein